jgi:hypothetical protein
MGVGKRVRRMVLSRGEGTKRGEEGFLACEFIGCCGTVGRWNVGDMGSFGMGLMMGFVGVGVGDGWMD